MGFQGPLTAQALGRSPYDEVFQPEVEGDVESDGHENVQLYDHRGRPVNLETKRRTRDIIRAHNEVMLVVGVAEPENPGSGPEAESRQRHSDYENTIGLRLIWVAKRCVEAVGVFGVTGLRQRILIYRRYSEIPFWEIYQAARKNPSPSTTMLPGAAVTLLSDYVERYVAPLWIFQPERALARRCVLEVWSYVRVHLELYATFQRLGLISTTKWLPPLQYFIPFTKDSPIPSPPPLDNLGPQSILSWFGNAVITATPFFMWILTQRMVREWRPYLWQKVISRLPSPMDCRIPPPPRQAPITPPPPPPPPPPQDTGAESQAPAVEDDTGEDSSPWDPDEGPNSGDAGQSARRQSVFSALGADDYGSDEDENEVVSATLISFDVEATESADVPQGLWSAELRPSVATDPRATSAPPIRYFSTMLRRMPSAMAAKIFNDSLLRLIIAPYETIALRRLAKIFCLRRGLPYGGLLSTNLFDGFNWTWIVNVLGTEFFHLFLTGEVLAFFMSASYFFYETEEEWKKHDDRELGAWAKPFDVIEAFY